MAAGRDESPRPHSTPARQNREYADALLSPAGLTHKPPTEAPAVGLFFCLVLGLHSGKLPTDCLQTQNRKRVHYCFYSNEPLSVLVGRVGLEPTTKGL